MTMTLPRTSPTTLRIPTAEITLQHPNPGRGRRRWSVALGLVLAGVPAAGASADVLVDQPNDLGNGYTSQIFTDYPEYTGSCFDDFTLGGATILGSLVVYGTDSFFGSGASNVDVIARIYLAPDLGSPLVAQVSGTQVGSDLLFDLSSVTLDAGTYWLSAVVERPFDVGGQWFWNVSSTMNGAQAMYHNPGGGFGVGTGPVSIAALGATAHDMAFLLEGVPVPAPAGFVAFALAAAVARRRRV